MLFCDLFSEWRLPTRCTANAKRQKRGGVLLLVVIAFATLLISLVCAGGNREEDMLTDLPNGYRLWTRTPSAGFQL